ncbi:GNAT family N-acetyltransferase [Granulicella arctica]|uniref:GNAT superfamily N-acetyltransferase n=1 Tax=Granulicella arctica TaxID=940613 RepID=A0A7Y9PIR6_9BACT|nr:GNAT family N-acetyltransferase [Granulicella arctica]NYF80597.1 GNAT superfamily N-acetyltransferase [Granulicella arctica]
MHPATLADEDFLRELFGDAHSEEYIPLGLPPSALGEMLAMQYRAQRTTYEAQFPNAVNEVIWMESVRVGRVLIDESSSEIRLVDVALLGPWRGAGVGTSILKVLCTRARRARLPLRLSVRLGNRAERLYSRLGFVRTGCDGMNVAMELREPMNEFPDTPPVHESMELEAK